MPDKYHTDVRLQLLALGYAIIPNRGKQPSIKGWNERGYAAQQLASGPKGSGAERVEGWPGRFPDALSTGVRIENGLCVIDVDVDDNDVMTQFWADLAAIVPDVAARAPTRFGGGEHKVALFCRVEGEKWTRIASRRYDGHCVEIFGGAALPSGKCSRQFGVYGPHSFNADGSVARVYQWSPDAPALAQAAGGELPAITIAQAHALVDAFERAAQVAGWTVEAQPDAAAAAGTAVYDIDEDTRFDTNTGSTSLSYDELTDELAIAGERLRCASSFMAGRDGTNRERCWVFHSPRHDCTAVFVYGDEQTHYPKQFAPRADAVEEALRTLLPRPHDPHADRADTADGPPRPGETGSMQDKALWLLLSYAYCAIGDTVVELHKAADDCHLAPTAFQRLFRAWREQVIGPKGGISYAYATGYWEVNHGRVDVEGVRMRPDMPFPLYAEGGRAFKNTYLRPRHDAAGGDAGLWVRYMEHLLPDPVERAWFCDWLAHKHLNPGVPGVAVVMVASGPDGPVYGAGRGILRDILSRLLGPRYVKPIDFDVFTGRSAQGVYTDWGAYATLVTVDEAKDTPESGRWAERRAVYERLREIVDPRAIERTFIVKGGQAFTGRSFASYLVFSNNRDALQVPEGDRRIAALANGTRMAPEMAAALQAWMAEPANIAALAGWLEARDLSAFDAYAPPVTDTKSIMQELARSELDDAFAAVRRLIGPLRLFTGEQVRGAVVLELNDVTSIDEVRRWVTRRLRAEAVAVGDFKLPPSQGRHKILQWRGTDCRWVDTAEKAQSVTAQTAEAIIRRYHSTKEGPLASVLQFTPTTPEGEK